MKIAVPADVNHVESEVGGSFARTPHFFIFNSDHNDGFFIDNPSVKSHGGAGIKAAQFLIDHHIDVLLAPRCGENAAKVLKAAQMEIYETNTGSIKENIDALFNGRLTVMEQFHKGSHHGGK
ncbi:MAG: NifB/NifX family molybdenum-iron cluster-binding protein [Bacillus sp. (in: firmicutes)]